MARRYHDKQWLKERYVGHELTTREIGNMCGVSKQTISNWLHRHGIETRPSNTREGATYDRNEKFEDKEWLKREYIDREKSGHLIAREQGVTNQTVYNWLENHGIERRDGHEAQFGTRKAPKHPKLENEEWLREQYVKNGRSQISIGDELGVTSPCVKYWLDIHGVTKRHDGPQNSLDTQFQRDPEWPERRQKAIKRDGDQCADCGISSTDYERDFDVHHLTRKDNFIQEDGTVDWASANHVGNLVTLCRSCHLKRHTS